jgi:hypothetical protein
MCAQSAVGWITFAVRIKGCAEHERQTGSSRSNEMEQVILVVLITIALCVAILPNYGRSYVKMRELDIKAFNDEIKRLARASTAETGA